MSTPQRQSRYPIAPEISGGPPMSPQGQQQPPFNQQPPLNQQQPFQPPQNTFGKSLINLFVCEIEIVL